MLTRRGVIVAGGAALMSAGAHPAPAWRVPEEGVRHERTFMQWPASRLVYPDDAFLAEVQRTVARIANTVAEFEPVVMLMAAEHEPAARRLLGDGVEVWDIPTEDLWCRDSGPLFATDGRGGLAVVDLNFNGWGGRQVHGRDGRIAARVAGRMGLPLLDSGLVGEGGGVETDGAGTLLAHESSWVNPNRNACSRAETGQRLMAAFGAEKVIWAPGLAGLDITDYHIDALARFVRPGEVAIQLPDRRGGDIWARAAWETHDILAAATDAARRRLQLTPLPEPRLPAGAGPDFVASYANYYVCNGAVIASAFGDLEADALTSELLQALHPDREVVMLAARALGEIGGGIHCATREQPAE